MIACAVTVLLLASSSDVSVSIEATCHIEESTDEIHMERTMSANFERAFGIVVGIEAGYVNDPLDPGGETKFGISKRAYPKVDIANLTLDQAKAIYERDYWDAHGLDSLEWGKALPVFDCAVNGGNHERWYQMYGGYRVPDFIEAFQAERFLYLTSLPGFAHDGRGWSRRLITIALKAVQP